ncbi:MAG: hypothetical protein JXP34_16805 [Planctomycetes bacterium]|nr:hypothetical protein [Planctomycetota bacterium]
MDVPFPLLILPAFMGVGIWLIIWTYSRGRRILEHWAIDNGYRLLSSEFRWLRRGPFFWTSSKGQMIFYVVIQTRDGETRRGWVRCGGFWWGLMQDKAEVRWDE